ncbi:MAG: zinc-dependent alcohol dehydrogenase family protein [Myxococcales bacterium]|nr:zinc-dependent alcohol dehydrogenase family protein [Myxococcales bacterium]
MKSARIDTFSDDPSAVEVREASVPRPAAGQVRVRMKMAPVNPSDFNYMDGIYERSFARMIWNRGAERPTDSPGSSEPFPRPPYALGVEGVGVVEESGGGFLGGRLVGKRVAVVSGPPHGTWQEQTLIDARRAFPVPRSLSDAQACSFFVNPLTALVLVRHVLQVPRGSVLLQTAAGSALSQMVRNLARADGFRVIDVVRSRSGAERLKQGNAKYVVALEDEDMLDAVYRIAPRGVDYVLDCVGGSTGSEALRALTPGGRMVCYGTLSREPISLPPRDIMMPMTSVEGFYLAAYLAKRTLFQRLGLVRKTAKLIEGGVLGTPVEQTYRLDALHEALAHARRPGRAGKILLDLSSEATET